MILGLSFILLQSCNKSSFFFESLPASYTNISFTNTIDSSKNFRILYFFYYYNGAGVATGDINNDGLPDIYFTANSKGNNKLYLNKGNFQFEDITEKANVSGTSDWCTGVTMADVNGDNYLDIYVSSVNNIYNFKGRNELFINNRDGTFTESAVKFGLDISAYSNQAAFFDYDHDGDLDCYILNQSFKPNENLVDTSNRTIYDQNSGDRIYRNDLNTTGKFTDVSKQAGIYQSSLGYGLGISVADFNNDGWDDIYIGNDFHENDYYYINNGDGTFNESGEKHFSHYSRFSMGNDAADFNNDGQLDIVTADMLPDNEKVLKSYGSGEALDIYNLMITKNGFQYQSSKNCLQRNNGSATSFSEIGLYKGMSATDWSWCPLFADFDNDGYKDLFITSGIPKRTVDMDYIRFISNLTFLPGADKKEKYNEALSMIPDGASYNHIFKNNPDGIFEDKSKDWGFEKDKGYFNGASYADLNNDGNLDLVVNCINAPAMVYKNNSPKKNYLSIAFKGDSLNTKGIGCKAYLFQKGKLQYQQLMTTRGFQSSSDIRLHFGFDSTAAIDSVLMVWPDQKYQTLKNITANQFITIDHKSASGKFNYHDFFKPVSDLLSRPDTMLNWKHKEDKFNDFNIQYLIPHAQSTRGPKVAVADVNNDGLDDMYACGARGQAGALFIQHIDHTFHLSDTILFKKNVLSEDVDAAFFDANSDGFKDLYVVSGGNVYLDGDPNLTDRLYINDGKGNFKKDSSALPNILTNKSCVTTADIDHDGDEDVFIGTLANAHAYGIPQSSHLLINDGKGHFTGASQSLINLDNIGMVTSASFADINKDGWRDLVIAGEWMSIYVFMNDHGNFKSSAIPSSTGWWQTLYADDVNNDGNVDILAGNWGLNNKFSTGKDGPVKLYVSDFDKNGQIDQLLSYTLKGEEYPFLAKDEVERSLPLLKKHYLKYAEYAGVPMKEVFYGWVDTVKPLIAERLASSLYLGDGKGNFSLKELPADLQLAPIFSFKKINSTPSVNQYLAGGNFYNVIPYEGRYDAQALSLFSVNTSGEIKYLPQLNLGSVQAQVRDIQIINIDKTHQQIVVALNDGPLLFYKRFLN